MTKIELLVSRWFRAEKRARKAEKKVDRLTEMACELIKEKKVLSDKIDHLETSLGEHYARWFETERINKEHVQTIADLRRQLNNLRTAPPGPMTQEIPNVAEEEPEPGRGTRVEEETLEVSSDPEDD